MKKIRYPGVNPFGTDETDRFFGRKEDIADLVNLVVLEKVGVLFGKSGYGKSSLINAGIIPELKKDDDFLKNFIPIRIRVGSFFGEGALMPLESLIFRLNETEKPADSNLFLDELVSIKNLWYHFKRRQTDAPKRYLLIFDQFEEFFTFPLAAQNAFKNELSDLIYLNVPKTVQDKSEKLTREERSFLSTEIEVHVLFVVREDRLSLLDNLRDRFPAILNKRYQLRALSREQAEEAIVKPAKLENQDFISPPFDYSDAALNKILDELSQTGPSQRATIEAFQLQIVCQFIESSVTEGGIISRVKGEKPEVRVEDLPDLSNIYEAYYSRKIEQLPKEVQQAAKNIIEDGLLLEDIVSGEGRRLSLDKDLLVKQFDLTGVRQNLLNQLEDTFLIRREVNTLGGFNYEVSHDTLIAPILHAKRERREIELVQQLNATKKASRRRRQAVLLVSSLALLVVLAFNWAYLSAFAITLTRGQDRPLVRDWGKLESSVKLLTQQLSKESGDMGDDSKKTFFGSPWLIGQVLTALNEKADDLPKAEFIRVLKKRIIDSCCCWDEVNRIKDMRPTGWVIGGLYRIGWEDALGCNLNKFILQNQLPKGAWSMIEIKPFSKDGELSGKYSSTYATCQSLLGLKKAKGDSVKVQLAIKEGLNWLITHRNKAKWRDYPNNTEEATIESKSISGLAIHTLNTMGIASDEINQQWLDNLDMIDAVNPITTKEQSDVFYRLGGLSEHFHDPTRHIVMPWLIIATVDAYPSGTLSQKVKANLWLSKAINKINQKELQEMFSFERAEILIGLRYLLENRNEL